MYQETYSDESEDSGGKDDSFDIEAFMNKPTKNVMSNPKSQSVKIDKLDLGSILLDKGKANEL